MAVTMPSDLFLPQLALTYTRQAFNDSIQLMQRLVSADPSSPVQLINDPTMEVSQYLQQPRFARMGLGLISVRDITSNSTATVQKMTAVNDIGVKLHRKVGPVEWTYDAARLAGLGHDDETRAAMISAEYGRQVGEYMALHIQRSVVAALKGMVEGMTSTAHTSTVWNATSRTNLSPAVLNAGLNLMADARDSITSWVMRSESVQDLYTDAIGRSYPNVGDQALRGNTDTNTLGKVKAMIDDPSLTSSPGGFNKFFTLGLGSQCLQVYATLPFTSYVPFIATERETVTVRLRGDFDIELAPRGFQWNSVAGGANPSDSALATSTNWTPTYTSHKEVKIIEIVHNYSGS